MVSSSSALLYAAIIQGAFGTFFPPVNDAPPIPSQAFRGLQAESFNGPEDLPRDLPHPNEERYFPTNRKPEEGRWYYEETQLRDSTDSLRSIESFDGYYKNGAPAIGPVATPVPDDAYLVQSSRFTQLNPTDIRKDNRPGIFILTRGGSSERWEEVQIPSERLLEVANQNRGFVVARNAGKTIAAPVPFDNPPRTQIQPNPPIVRIRLPSAVNLPKIYSNSPTFVENAPIVKQIETIQPLPQPNVKNIIQQQIVSDAPSVVLPPPATAQFTPKRSFVIPPPPPPPLKGLNSSPKVISSVPLKIIPDSNTVVSNKNIITDPSAIPVKSTIQQVRHIWIPTSSRSGKFITIPISSSINSEKSIISKDFSLDSTPVTVSDTWILRQDGPVPFFEQRKSALPPAASAVVQNGKVIFENPTIVQVDGPGSPLIGSQKNTPVFDKAIQPNPPRDIWPIRQEVITSKVSNNYPQVIVSEVPSAVSKSDAVTNGKSVSVQLPSPQKSIVTKSISAFPPKIPSSNIQVVNGKPCPLPLPGPQKLPFPPLNTDIRAFSRTIPTQKSLPYPRIIKINRYPTGSYYLLDRNIRPNYYIYPNQELLQQSKGGIISIVQTKQLPAQLQRNIPIPPVQTKQISIPVQSKQITSPFPAKSAPYPFVSRQLILPLAAPKSSRIVYPTVQAIRYPYPWNGYLNSAPIFSKVPQFSRFKAGPYSSESESSSSESSSSEESPESPKERKAKSKKEKAKNEAKPKSEEKSNSGESESDENSKSIEKESVESKSEKDSQESLGTSESKSNLNVYKTENRQGNKTRENASMNFIHAVAISEESHSHENKSK